MWNVFTSVSFHGLCSFQTHRQLIDSYDALLSNSTMLNTVTGAAPLAESMLNKKLRRCEQHWLKTPRRPLTHPFSLVPLQRPMHELHWHLLVLCQPGQDELQEPAGKQRYIHKSPFSFLFCLQPCFICLVLSSFHLKLTAEQENVTDKRAFLHGVLGHSVSEDGQLLYVLIVEPLDFEVQVHVVSSLAEFMLLVFWKHRGWQYMTEIKTPAVGICSHPVQPLKWKHLQYKFWIWTLVDSSKLHTTVLAQSKMSQGVTWSEQAVTASWLLRSPK